MKETFFSQFRRSEACGSDEKRKKLSQTQTNKRVWSPKPTKTQHRIWERNKTETQLNLQQYECKDVLELCLGGNEH